MSSKINRRRRESGYKILATNALRDPNLSYGAKGLHSYVFQLPPEIAANLTIELLQSKSKNGRDSCAALIKELINARYVTRQQIRDNKGHFLRYDYDFFEEPISPALDTTPVNGKPVNGKPVNGKPVYGETENGMPENGKPVTYNNYIVDSNNKELEELRIKKAGGLETAAGLDFLEKKLGENEQAPPKAPPAPVELFEEGEAGGKQKAGGRKKAGAVVIFPPALDTPEFRKVWADFIELRKKRKQPVGIDSYQNPALDNLGKYPLNIAVEAIEKTAAAGWQGIFPESVAAQKEKEKNAGKKGGGGFNQTEPTPERLPVAPKKETPTRRQPTAEQLAALEDAKQKGVKEFLTVPFVSWDKANVLQPVFELLKTDGYLDKVTPEVKKTLWDESLAAARAELEAEYAGKENLSYGRRAELKKALAETNGKPAQIITDTQTRIYRKKLLFAVQQKLIK